MATIKIKGGQSTNLPESLQERELAVTLDTGKLYVGTGSGKLLLNPDPEAVTNVQHANTADKLTNARNFIVGGMDITSDGCTFDGSQDVQMELVLNNSGVTAGTYPKVTVDAKGRVTKGATLAATDIPTLPSSKITGLGTAATKNTGTASGNVPVLDSGGKLSTSVLPALAITDTLTAASESAMLALTAQKGDICVRTDVSKTYILSGDSASTLSNWVELKTPDCKVISVAGKTGAVTLTKTDVGLGNVDNTADSAKAVSSAAKLTTARTIALSGAATGTATSFNGTANITIPVTAIDGTKVTGKVPAAAVADAAETAGRADAAITAEHADEATTATKLATARGISITGGATAAAKNFDGTAAIALNVTSLDASKLSGTIDGGTF